MAKRPVFDLSSLTAEAAEPMQEAAQRAARPVAAAETTRPQPGTSALPTGAELTKTANLEALAFKVSPVFRKRFRRRAHDADLKLNELLFEALDAWEEKHGIK